MSYTSSHHFTPISYTPYTPFHHCYHYHTHRAQADLVQAALKQRGFEQTKCYFAMRYWHPFTEEVSSAVWSVAYVLALMLFVALTVLFIVSACPCTCILRMSLL